MGSQSHAISRQSRRLNPCPRTASWPTGHRPWLPCGGSTSVLARPVRHERGLKSRAPDTPSTRPLSLAPARFASPQRHTELAVAPPRLRRNRSPLTQPHQLIHLSHSYYAITSTSLSHQHHLPTLGRAAFCLTAAAVVTGAPSSPERRHARGSPWPRRFTTLHTSIFSGPAPC